MAVNVESQGQFSTALVVAMNTAGLTIKDLAEKTDMTYENARRLVKGMTLPSKYVLKEICKILKLDFAKMENMVIADKFRRKFGDTSVDLMGHRPSLAPLEEIWDHLTEDQQKDLIAMAKGLLRRNGTK